MRRRTRALALAAGTLVRCAVASTFALSCSSNDDAPPGGSSGGATAQGGASGATAGSAAGGGATAGSAGGGHDGGKGGGAAGSGARSGAAGSGGGRGGTAGANGGSTALGGTSGREPTGEAGTAGGGEEPTVCDDNCHYVRADGSGDGSSWANAASALPSELTRGQVYFVAGGTYPAHDFDDAPSGELRIRIVRATADDHGTSDGWNDSFAESESVFGELDFRQPGYDFEGRGATRAVGSFQGTVVRVAGDGTHFSGVDVDGAFLLSAGMHTGGACTGMEISGNDVVVRGNRVHDIADDGVVVGGNRNLLFEGNEIDSLYGCGTDGDCGPCDNGHSDGLELYAVHDSQFVGNFAHDIASTSTFFFGNWADELGDGPADYCENVLLANNVLYNPDTGFVAYLEDVRGVTLVGNTIWGAHQGRYGGLAVGVNVSGLDIYDNVILSINYEHLESTFNPSEHHGDYNLFGISLGQWTDAAHDVVALDPGFAAIPDADGAKVEAPTPADFTPTATSPLRGAGTSDALELPTRDFFGTLRTSPPTIGAIE